MDQELVLIIQDKDAECPVQRACPVRSQFFHSSLVLVKFIHQYDQILLL